MPTLTSAARRALRANAHALHPVVAIGQHGLTPAVLHEIDGALKAHELIKVRVFDDDRDAREAMLARVCAELDCAAVQHIGKLLVVWRPNPPPPVAAKRPHKSAAKTSAKPGAGARRRSDDAKAPAAAPRETGAGTRRRRAGAAAEPPAPTGRRERSRSGAGAPAAPATRGVPSRRRRRTVKS